MKGGGANDPAMIGMHLKEDKIGNYGANTEDG